MRRIVVISRRWGWPPLVSPLASAGLWPGLASGLWPLASGLWPRPITIIALESLAPRPSPDNYHSSGAPRDSLGYHNYHLAVHDIALDSACLFWITLAPNN